VRGLLAWLLLGVATVYGGSEEAHFNGRPLFCDGCTTHLHYDVSAAPWVAVDASEYRSGRVHCEDELWLTFGNGARLQARAYDAGQLYNYETVLGGPIVVDVPAHLAPFEGLTTVRVVNHSAAARELARRAGP